MDDIPSHWPLRWKALALALLIVVVLAVRWGTQGVVGALPRNILDLAFIGMVCLLVGFFIGERSATKRVEREWDSRPSNRLK
jgi:hypothetical protein